MMNDVTDFVQFEFIFMTFSRWSLFFQQLSTFGISLWLTLLFFLWLIHDSMYYEFWWAGIITEFSKSRFIRKEKFEHTFVITLGKSRVQLFFNLNIWNFNAVFYCNLEFRRSHSLLDVHKEIKLQKVSSSTPLFWGLGIFCSQFLLFSFLVNNKISSDLPWHKYSTAG